MVPTLLNLRIKIVGEICHAFTSRRKEITIGAHNCGITLPFEGVPSPAAKIELTGQKRILLHREDENVTIMVDGKPVQDDPVEISSDSQIRIADCEFTIPGMWDNN